MLLEEANNIWRSNVLRRKYLGLVLTMKEIGGKKYCLSESGDLCELDEKARKIIFVGSDAFKEYSDFCLTSGNYYFAPATNEHILIHYMSRQVMKYLPIEKAIHSVSVGKINFGGMAAWKNKIFFFPVNYPYLVSLDTETEEICYHRDCFRGWVYTSEGEPYVGAILQEGKNVILASRLSNRVAELDLENGRMQPLGAIGPEDSDCCTIVKEDNEVYWFFPWKSSKIRRWDRKRGVCEVIDEYPDGFFCGTDRKDDRRCMYVVAKKSNNYIWLFYTYGNRILRLNLQTKCLEVIQNIHFEENERKDFYCLGYIKLAAANGIVCVDDEKAVLLSTEDNCLLTIDINHATVRRQPYEIENNALPIDDEPIKSMAEMLEKCENITWENDLDSSLIDYLNYVTKMDMKNTAQKKGITAGEKIYNSLVKGLTEEEGEKK